jgi:hypothetical protein
MHRIVFLLSMTVNLAPFHILMSPIRIVALATLVTSAASGAPPIERIPEPLKSWATWATWNDEHRACPTPYSDPNTHFCFWPSRFGLQVQKGGAQFDMVVTVFHETWLPLPGDANAWPLEVRVNGAAVPVLDHAGAPSVRLAAGTMRLEGAYRWDDIPQRIRLPREIGILALKIDGQPVEAPVWDAQGFLWLKRDGSSEEADKNFLSLKLYTSLEDGIPLWLRTEIELTVSGKSREEDLGTILPEGWKLGAIESPIPVAVDEAGKMKAQVRAGKWTVRADAFRFDNPKQIRYAEGAKPAAAEELFAFRARPDFRIVEFVGAPSIDVSQTTFPEKWRELPVYRWDTATPFQIEERMRGMGDQKPAGLRIARELWLDENGSGLTFRDAITGAMQQIWRLDAAEGQDLGSVRSDGQGQLITRNPQNGAPGVEIRTRNLNLEATGRMARASALSATGWRSDADGVNATLNLPPGWRLFALFGADWVRGDWLTAWTLLDLFLLLIFSLAVFRLWGFFPGLLAFVAFGLAYHEPGAPRYLWLILLVPLALQRVVPEGWAKRILCIGKWIAIGAFVLVLVPFIARQVQQALYPQLEIVTSHRFSFMPAANINEAGIEEGRQQGAIVEQQAPAAPADASRAREEARDSYSLFGASRPSKLPSSKDNLLYDAKARIQTGPGVPEWKWRAVSFGWNGPVQASQRVKPVLIPLGIERVLSILRVVLLLVLAAVLLNVRRFGGAMFAAGKKAAVVFAFAGTLANATAQTENASAQQQAATADTASDTREKDAAIGGGTVFPDQTTLRKLRERLLEVSDAYPTAADIPSVTLALTNRKIIIDAEVHAAIRTAVPFPGKLPAWSPLSVLVDDKPEVALRRGDDYLWLVVPEGVHRVRVEGSLANITEWEWTFLLKPRLVKIDAPDWNYSGVRPSGVPEQQVFFTLKQKAAAGQASYDRQDLQSVAAIDRSLELGLIWQVRTTVKRLSPAGKAVALRVPLLPGENVLTSNTIVKDGFIEVRLGAQEESFAWESGLAVVNELKLATRADDAWVERWHLVVSPVWNVSISGLVPIFEPGSSDLVPVWQPWPGESVDLAISRPEAIAGATVTVSRGTHQISLGKRQRVSKLDISLRCSLGEDFLVTLPKDAEVTMLMHNGKSIPVRKDGNNLIIPLRPGEQSMEIGWKINTALGFRAEAEEVRLPVESANIQTVITVPDDRWVLWAIGPRLGPAVRFWGILICSLLAAIALGRLAHSPIKTISWMLLVIGLTQVPLPAALTVVGWLFLLSWRGSPAFKRLGDSSYNSLQVVLVALTAIALAILLVAVGEGLLGSPEMFITGNGSSRTVLRWFQARSGNLLPRPDCFSISIWWYRFFMLAWALWLAASLIRWLRLGWQNFSSGGFFRRKPKPQPAPPPLPLKP